MTLDASGRLMVGMTNFTASLSNGPGFGVSPIGYIQVLRNQGISVAVGRTVSTGTIIEFEYGSTDTNADTVGYISTNGTTITFSGNALSDARHKENIYKISNGLKAINSLDFVTFDFKESGRPSAGVTSQQAETVPEIAPFVVNGIAEEDYKAFDYNALIGYLGAAIQELSQEIETLKQRIK